MVEMETIVSLCKRRGFIFPSSEIYGGFNSCWDYGPLGVELKNNVKRAWWKAVVQMRDDMVGLDGSILMHPKVWEASGHVANFSDPMVDCRACKLRFRADQVDPNEKCVETKGPHDLTESRQFNMMFRTHVGPVEDGAAVAYLRPETAQAIFVNFSNVQNTMRKKLPFGVAQIGKAFRNEITPGNFTFRTREFEQMEIEFFVKPGTDDEWHQQWIDARRQWYLDLGMKKENLQLREHEQDELAHYARRCVDIEYSFPIGWSELEGIANRTDFDLKQHTEFSGKDLTWFDPETNEHVMPCVIEPSAGADRATLAFLVDAYDEEVVRDRQRVVLRLHKDLAPNKVAVLPLLRNRPEIVDLARKIAGDLRPSMACMYDDTASIGKLYRRQDEIGTLYCVTVDVDSLTDHAVTIRERDSMEQVRVPVEAVVRTLKEKILG
ncbi:MAG: glycine--tRNA ligase [Armatimonadetes bacterium]|nr:glycine--tRNA ligase [Armatimonadota bacterium]